MRGRDRQTDEVEHHIDLRPMTYLLNYGLHTYLIILELTFSLIRKSDIAEWEDKECW